MHKSEIFNFHPIFTQFSPIFAHFHPFSPIFHQFSPISDPPFLRSCTTKLKHMKSAVGTTSLKNHIFFKLRFFPIFSNFFPREAFPIFSNFHQFFPIFPNFLLEKSGRHERFSPGKSAISKVQCVLPFQVRQIFKFSNKKPLRRRGCFGTLRENRTSGQSFTFSRSFRLFQEP